VLAGKQFALSRWTDAPKPMSPRFHDHEGICQLFVGIQGENSLQLGVDRRNGRRGYAEVQDASGITLQEHQPAEVAVASYQLMSLRTRRRSKSASSAAANPISAAVTTVWPSSRKNRTVAA
jgi:hypothetical protein